MNQINHKAGTKRIQELILLYKNGLLNLNPGFQRKSVWGLKDRKKLIDSILRNYPLPAIFLYVREKDGRQIYDVIDGKQRIESILMFAGNIRGRFSVKSQLLGESVQENLSWNIISRKKRQTEITKYELPVIEVDGELSDIIDVFVRINSTGKALTPQEKRNARYYNSDFLKIAGCIAKKYEWYFYQSGVFSEGQLSRMKHIELICELILSLLQGDVLNKKNALDRVMGSANMDGRELRRGVRLVQATLNRTRRMFPKIKASRFRQITDFYSLSLLVGKFEQEGMILTDKKRNKIAWDLLRNFGIKVDEVRELQRMAKGARSGDELYREYLLTVSQMTDDVNQRRKREKILRGLLESLFSKKDENRGFTPEQRRIIWNSDAKKSCSYSGCRVRLGWDNFTIDHIQPHSKGGRSNLSNAALMCRMHNSKKGNRRG